MARSDDGCKRKTEEEEAVVICFLFSNRSCAGLFNLKLSIYGDNLIVPENDVLNKLADFFFQPDQDAQIYFFSCASFAVGSSSCKYLVFANEFDRTLQCIDFPSLRNEKPLPFVRGKPCEYTFENNQVHSYPSSLENSPIALKMNPMAVTVDNKVYVLSCRNEMQVIIQEPSFEAYDPEKKTWEALPSPWFNLLNPPPFLPAPESIEYWNSTGYAVFGHFIIVASLNTTSYKFLIHSYNTLSQEWKPVRYPATLPQVVYRDDGTTFFNPPAADDYDDTDDEDRIAVERCDPEQCRAANLQVWVGEAVAVKNFIYAYVSVYNTLVSYKCSADTNNDTLSFDGRIAAERCHRPECWSKLRDEVSGAVCKIRDELICVVKTILVNKRQPVHLMIFRLDDEQGGISTVLHSFDLTMPGNFSPGCISSCSVLPPEVTSNWRLDEHNPKRRELS